jgi:hypothetical protein
MRNFSSFVVAKLNLGKSLLTHAAARMKVSCQQRTTTCKAPPSAEASPRFAPNRDHPSGKASENANDQAWQSVDRWTRAQPRTYNNAVNNQVAEQLGGGTNSYRNEQPAEGGDTSRRKKLGSDSYTTISFFAVKPSSQKTVEAPRGKSIASSEHLSALCDTALCCC